MLWFLDSTSLECRFSSTQLQIFLSCHIVIVALCRRSMSSPSLVVIVDILLELWIISDVVILISSHFNDHSSWTLTVSFLLFCFIIIAVTVREIAVVDLGAIRRFSSLAYTDFSNSCFHARFKSWSWWYPQTLVACHMFFWCSWSYFQVSHLPHGSLPTFGVPGTIHSTPSAATSLPTLKFLKLFPTSRFTLPRFHILIFLKLFATRSAHHHLIMKLFTTSPSQNRFT